MSSKSVKKFYRQQSSYEYADAYGWRGGYTRYIMRFVKKRSHKRLRKQDVLLKNMVS